jgi:hypothetical protein
MGRLSGQMQSFAEGSETIEHYAAACQHEIAGAPWAPR